MRLQGVIVLLGVLLTTAGLPATNAVPTGHDALDEAVAALQAGAYGDAFRAMAASQGAALPAEPVVAGPAEGLVLLAQGELDLAGAEAVLDRVPVELRPTIDTLLVGLAKADGLVQNANAALLAGHDGPVTLADLLGLPTEGWLGMVRTTSADAMPAVQAPVSAHGSDDVARPIDGADSAPYLLAQAIALDAVEQATALLADVGLDPFQPGTEGVGDIVDERPFIIVSGTANDVYVPGDDAIIVLDLGGNDVYDNAQGTPFGIPGLAQVIVDVSGNDRYERSSAAPAGLVQVAAQGAGVAGVGGIVDLLGDDRYTARASYVPSDDEVSASVLAQGAGTLGAGFLIDAGGLDCLVATARSHGSTAAVVAQGAGVLGAGLNVMLGTAAADGRQDCEGLPYADATSDPLVDVDTETEFRAVLGPAVTIAQGAADAGAGAYVGGASSDGYVATAFGGIANTVAQGAALAGAGVLVDAGGGDTYLADARSEAVLHGDNSGQFSFAFSGVLIRLGDTLTLAQGAATVGAAALADAGTAANRFVASASLLADGSATVNLPWGGEFGTAQTISIVDVGNVRALAHGAAATGVAVHTTAGLPSVLSGGAGDARDVTASLRASSVATSTGGSQNIADAQLFTGDSEATGQGWTQLGAGLLADAGGNDAYTLRATHDTFVDAVTAPAGSETVTSSVGTAEALGHAKATTGVAGLIDVDGVDTYTKVPGPTPATNDACYTDSPPDFDPNVGVGADLLSGTPTVPASCLPTPPN